MEECSNDTQFQQTPTRAKVNIKRRWTRTLDGKWEEAEVRSNDNYNYNMEKKKQINGQTQSKDKGNEFLLNAFVISINFMTIVFNVQCESENSVENFIQEFFVNDCKLFSTAFFTVKNTKAKNE